jgi:hypothetical protein
MSKFALSASKEMLKKAALALGGLAAGMLVTVVAKPTLESTIVPAVLKMFGQGEALLLYPSDQSEPSQKYTIYRFSFLGGVHGVFVSAKAAPDGSFQTFYVNGQAHNGLTYFTFVPSDEHEKPRSTTSCNLPSGIVGCNVATARSSTR